MTTSRRVTVLLTAAVLGFATGAGIHLATEDPSARKPDTPLMSFGHCGESLPPDPAAAATTLASATGPVGNPRQDRTVELRTQQHPRFGKIVWAHLHQSADILDRLWFDWSYENDPAEEPRWRQCGAQPITQGSSTPAVKAVDDAGRVRWFRACGQVPPHHRSARLSGTFCSDWMTGS